MSTTTPKVLIPSKIIEDTEETQYTADRVTAIIDKCTARNFSGSAETITISLVTAADSPGNDNIIISQTIQAGKTYTFPEVVGHMLMPSGYISTLASTTNTISFRVSGREVTG